VGSFLLIAALALGATAGPAPGAAVDRATVREVAGRLVCYCGTCSNQSIRDCTCGTAASAREEIRTRLEQGESPQAILKYYTERYGEQILIAPDRKGFNLIAWVTPFLALFIGGGGLMWALRRLSIARPAAAEAGVNPASGPPDPQVLARIEREMREYDG
jgi:cytochrome c-type biogenesis protein CcmH